MPTINIHITGVVVVAVVVVVVVVVVVIVVVVAAVVKPGMAYITRNVANLIKNVYSLHYDMIRYFTMLSNTHGYLSVVYNTNIQHPSTDEQEAVLSQRGRAMLRVCIALIQNVKRSLLLLVVSALDIPLVQLNSFLFSSAYSSMLQAVTNKHSLMRRRLCDLHCRGR